MTGTRTLFVAAASAMLLAVPAQAQQPASTNGAAATETTDDAVKKGRFDTQPAITMQHFRAQDQRGLNVFEPPKEPGVPYTGFRLDWGAAFTQQFQSLSHRNENPDELATNNLMAIGSGFNNANANLYLNAQLAPGIRVALSTYLSSRHHPEAWVKDGYLLVDASPIDLPILHDIMSLVTLRLGHFEINYGDSHFRRSDNGNALFNPFVGNYIMDAFTTEIGGEVYLRSGPFMVMGGLTGGEIRGQVVRPDDRAPAYLAKLGFDQQVTPTVRTRLTGSMYTTAKSMSNSLFAGDRAGSRYYFVMENTTANEANQFRSGSVVPGFGSEVRAFQVNPFVKVGGAELFGVIEQAQGRTAAELTAEAERRTFEQYAVDALYRFLPDEQAYFGARYNTVSGRLPGMGQDISVNRYQIGGGWFVTPGVLLKAEYVNQQYKDYPTTSILNQGRFNGFVVEGVVSF
jgi:hypothetical protein